MVQNIMSPPLLKLLLLKLLVGVANLSRWRKPAAGSPAAAASPAARRDDLWHRRLARLV